MSRRITAFFVLIFFILTNHSNSGFAVTVPETPAGLNLKHFPQDITRVSLPAPMGKVEEWFQGESGKTVVVIQDAHSIPDAQKSIQKIIGFFQKEYGVRHVGLEGASSRLDPQIFKSFPDKKRLRQVFSQYLNQGELTAGTGAAIFSEGLSEATVFQGVEDWELYEQGLGLYLAAMNQEKKLLEEVEGRRRKAEGEKERIYSGELLEIDKKLESFRRNESDLSETLNALAAIKRPEDFLSSARPSVIPGGFFTEPARERSRAKEALVIPGGFSIEPARERSRAKEALVIPAEAGIQTQNKQQIVKVKNLDPRLRGDDMTLTAERTSQSLPPRKGGDDMTLTAERTSQSLPPRKGGDDNGLKSLAAFLEEMKSEKIDDGSLELEVKRIAQRVGKYLEAKIPSPETKKDLLAYHDKLQDFRISRLSPQAFALFLKELIAKDRMGIKVSSRLLGGIENQKTMRDIEGTKFFRDFEAYAQAVKESLMQNEEQRVLDRETRELNLTEKLVKLELSREEWEEFRAYSVERIADRKEILEGLKIHQAFYANAEKRDAAFLKNLQLSAKRYPLSASLLIAGGFHAQGLTERLKASNISYLLVMPEIQSIPKTTNYQAQMRDEVSWKNYFKAENGKINLYEAFVRGTRDRLLADSGERIADRKTNSFDSEESYALYAKRSTLKSWRDQIIRDLAEKNKIEKSGNYTRFIDEVSGNKKDTFDARLKTAFEKIDRFVAGLRGLQEAGQLTEINIMNLVKPGAAIPRALAAAAAPESFATPKDRLARASAAGISFGGSRAETRARSEMRNLTAEQGQGVLSDSIYLDPRVIDELSFLGIEEADVSVIRRLIKTLAVSVPELREAARTKLRQYAELFKNDASVLIRKAAKELSDKELMTRLLFLVENLVFNNERGPSQEAALLGEIFTSIRVEGQERPMIFGHMTGLKPIWDESLQRYVMSVQKGDQSAESPGNRKSFHFTSNSLMESNWSDMSYAIVGPLDKLIQENASSFRGGLEGDLLFWGPVVLPEDTRIFETPRTHADDKKTALQRLLEEVKATGDTKGYMEQNRQVQAHFESLKSREQAIAHMKTVAGEDGVFNVIHTHEWDAPESIRIQFREKIFKAGLHYGHHGSVWDLELDIVSSSFDSLYYLLKMRRDKIQSWLREGGHPYFIEDQQYTLPWWGKNPVTDFSIMTHERFLRPVIRLFAENLTMTPEELWSAYLSNFRKRVPENELKKFDDSAGVSTQKRRLFSQNNEFFLLDDKFADEDEYQIILTMSKIDDKFKHDRSLYSEPRMLWVPMHILNEAFPTEEEVLEVEYDDSKWQEYSEKDWYDYLLNFIRLASNDFLVKNQSQELLNMNVLSSWVLSSSSLFNNLSSFLTLVRSADDKAFVARAVVIFGKSDKKTLDALREFMKAVEDAGMLSVVSEMIRSLTEIISLGSNTTSVVNFVRKIVFSRRQIIFKPVIQEVRSKLNPKKAWNPNWKRELILEKVRKRAGRHAIPDNILSLYGINPSDRTDEGTAAVSQPRSETREPVRAEGFSAGIEALEKIIVEKQGAQGTIIVSIMGGGGMGTSTMAAMLAKTGVHDAQGKLLVRPEDIAVIEGDVYMASFFQRDGKDMIRYRDGTEVEDDGLGYVEDRLHTSRFLRDLSNASDIQKKKVILIAGMYSNRLMKNVGRIPNIQVMFWVDPELRKNRVIDREMNKGETSAAATRLYEGSMNALTRITMKDSITPDLIVNNSAGIDEKELELRRIAMHTPPARDIRATLAVSDGFTPQEAAMIRERLNSSEDLFGGLPFLIRGDSKLTLRVIPASTGWQWLGLKRTPVFDEDGNTLTLALDRKNTAALENDLKQGIKELKETLARVKPRPEEIQAWSSRSEGREEGMETERQWLSSPDYQMTDWAEGGFAATILRDLMWPENKNVIAPRTTADSLREVGRLPVELISGPRGFAIDPSVIRIISDEGEETTIDLVGNTKFLHALTAILKTGGISASRRAVLEKSIKHLVRFNLFYGSVILIIAILSVFGGPNAGPWIRQILIKIMPGFSWSVLVLTSIPIFYYGKKWWNKLPRNKKVAARKIIQAKIAEVKDGGEFSRAEARSEAREKEAQEIAAVLGSREISTFSPRNLVAKAKNFYNDFKVKMIIRSFTKRMDRGDIEFRWMPSHFLLDLFKHGPEIVFPVLQYGLNLNRPDHGGDDEVRALVAFGLASPEYPFTGKMLFLRQVVALIKLDDLALGVRTYYPASEGSVDILLGLGHPDADALILGLANSADKRVRNVIYGDLFNAAQKNAKNAQRLFDLASRLDTENLSRTLDEFQRNPDFSGLHARNPAPGLSEILDMSELPFEVSLIPDAQRGGMVTVIKGAEGSVRAGFLGLSRMQESLHNHPSQDGKIIPLPSGYPTRAAGHYGSEEWGRGDLFHVGSTGKQFIVSPGGVTAYFYDADYKEPLEPHKLHVTFPGEGEPFVYETTQEKGWIFDVGGDPRFLAEDGRIKSFEAAGMLGPNEKAYRVVFLSWSRIIQMILRGNAKELERFIPPAILDFSKLKEGDAEEIAQALIRKKIITESQAASFKKALEKNITQSHPEVPEAVRDELIPVLDKDAMSLQLSGSFQAASANAPGELQVLLGEINPYLDFETQVEIFLPVLFSQDVQGGVNAVKFMLGDNSPAEVREAAYKSLAAAADSLSTETTNEFLERGLTDPDIRVQEAALGFLAAAIPDTDFDKFMEIIFEQGPLTTKAVALTGAMRMSEDQKKKYFFMYLQNYRSFLADDFSVDRFGYAPKTFFNSLVRANLSSQANADVLIEAYQNLNEENLSALIVNPWDVRPYVLEQLKLDDADILRVAAAIDRTKIADRHLYVLQGMLTDPSLLTIAPRGSGEDVVPVKTSQQVPDITEEVNALRDPDARRKMLDDWLSEMELTIINARGPLGKNSGYDWMLINVLKGLEKWGLGEAFNQRWVSQAVRVITDPGAKEKITSWYSIERWHSRLMYHMLGIPMASGQAFPIYQTLIKQGIDFLGDDFSLGASFETILERIGSSPFLSAPEKKVLLEAGLRDIDLTEHYSRGIIRGSAQEYNLSVLVRALIPAGLTVEEDFQFIFRFPMFQEADLLQAIETLKALAGGDTSQNLDARMAVMESVRVQYPWAVKALAHYAREKRKQLMKSLEGPAKEQPKNLLSAEARSEARTDVEGIAEVLGGTLGRRVAEILVNRIDDVFTPGREMNEGITAARLDLAEFQGRESIRKLLENKLAALKAAAGADSVVGMMTLYHQLKNRENNLSPEESNLSPEEKLLLRILEFSIPPIPGKENEERLPAERTEADVFESNLLVYAEGIKESVYSAFGMTMGLQAKDRMVQQEVCKFCLDSTSVFNYLAEDIHGDLGRFSRVDTMGADIEGKARHFWTEIEGPKGEIFYVSLVDSQFPGFGFDKSPDGKRDTGRVNVFQIVPEAGESINAARARILKERGGIELMNARPNNEYAREKYPKLLAAYSDIAALVQMKATKDEGAPAGTEAVEAEAYAYAASEALRSYRFVMLLGMAMKVYQSRSIEDRIPLVLSILQEASDFKGPVLPKVVNENMHQVAFLILKTYRAQTTEDVRGLPSNQLLTVETLKNMISKLGQKNIPSALKTVFHELLRDQKSLDRLQDSLEGLADALKVVKEAETLVSEWVDSQGDSGKLERLHAFIQEDPARLVLVAFDLNHSGRYSSEQTEKILRDLTAPGSQAAEDARSEARAVPLAVKPNRITAELKARLNGIAREAADKFLKGDSALTETEKIALEDFYLEKRNGVIYQTGLGEVTLAAKDTTLMSPGFSVWKGESLVGQMDFNLIGSGSHLVIEQQREVFDDPNDPTKNYQQKGIASGFTEVLRESVPAGTVVKQDIFNVETLQKITNQLPDEAKAHVLVESRNQETDFGDAAEFAAVFNWRKALSEELGNHPDILMKVSSPDWLVGNTTSGKLAKVFGDEDKMRLTVENGEIVLFVTKRSEVRATNTGQFHDGFDEMGLKTVPGKGVFELSKAAVYPEFLSRLTREFEDIRKVLPEDQQASPKLYSIGAGNGITEESLRDNLGFEIKGVELSQVQGAAAQERGLDIKIGDALEDMKILLDGSQNIVFIGEAIGYFSNDLDDLFSEVKRILAPGGVIVISTYPVEDDKAYAVSDSGYVGIPVVDLQRSLEGKGFETEPNERNILRSEFPDSEIQRYFSRPIIQSIIVAKKPIVQARAEVREQALAVGRSEARFARFVYKDTNAKGVIFRVKTVEDILNSKAILAQLKKTFKEEGVTAEDKVVVYQNPVGEKVYIKMTVTVAGVIKHFDLIVDAELKNKEVIFKNYSAQKSGVGDLNKNDFFNLVNSTFPLKLIFPSDRVVNARVIKVAEDKVGTVVELKGLASGEKEFIYIYPKSKVLKSDFRIINTKEGYDWNAFVTKQQGDYNVTILKRVDSKLTAAPESTPHQPAPEIPMSDERDASRSLTEPVSMGDTGIIDVPSPEMAEFEQNLKEMDEDLRAMTKTWAGDYARYLLSPKDGEQVTPSDIPVNLLDAYLENSADFLRALDLRIESDDEELDHEISFASPYRGEDSRYVATNRLYFSEIPKEIDLTTLINEIENEVGAILLAEAQKRNVAKREAAGDPDLEKFLEAFREEKPRLAFSNISFEKNIGAAARERIRQELERKAGYYSDKLRRDGLGIEGLRVSSTKQTSVFQIQQGNLSLTLKEQSAGVFRIAKYPQKILSFSSPAAEKQEASPIKIGRSEARGVQAAVKPSRISVELKTKLNGVAKEAAEKFLKGDSKLTLKERKGIEDFYLEKINGVTYLTEIGEVTLAAEVITFSVLFPGFSVMKGDLRVGQMDFKVSGSGRHLVIELRRDVYGDSDDPEKNYQQKGIASGFTEVLRESVPDGTVVKQDIFNIQTLQKMTAELPDDAKARVLAESVNRINEFGEDDDLAPVFNWRKALSEELRKNPDILTKVNSHDWLVANTTSGKLAEVFGDKMELTIDNGEIVLFVTKRSESRSEKRSAPARNAAALANLALKIVEAQRMSQAEAAAAKETYLIEGEAQLVEILREAVTEHAEELLKTQSVANVENWKAAMEELLKLIEPQEGEAASAEFKVAIGFIFGDKMDSSFKKTLLSVLGRNSGVGTLFAGGKIDDAKFVMELTSSGINLRPVNMAHSVTVDQAGIPVASAAGAMLPKNLADSFLGFQSNLEGLENDPMARDFVQLLEIVALIKTARLLAGENNLLKGEALRAELIRQLGSEFSTGNVISIVNGQFVINGKNAWTAGLMLGRAARQKTASAA